MSSKHDRKTEVTTFSCDKPGCHKNFEGEPGSFGDAWRAARAHGWIHMKDYGRGNIGESRHYCPDHAEDFEKPRGG